MNGLPLRSKFIQNRFGLIPRDDAFGKYQVDLAGSLQLLALPSLGQGRYRLQSPFFVGYPPKGVVAVLDNLLLPAIVLLLPLCPCLGRALCKAVHEGWLLRGEDVQALTVQKRPSGRNW